MKGSLRATWNVNNGPWQTLLNIFIWLRPSWNCMFFKQSVRRDKELSAAAVCDWALFVRWHICWSCRLWQNLSNGTGKHKMSSKVLAFSPHSWWARVIYEPQETLYGGRLFCGLFLSGYFYALLGSGACFCSLAKYVIIAIFHSFYDLLMAMFLLQQKVAMQQFRNVLLSR